MNIAIGKSGRSCYFNEERWSIYAGDDSPKIIYFEIARQNPQHTFYLIGASDFTKYIEKGGEAPSNIVDLWNIAKNDAKKRNLKYDYPYEILLNYVLENNYHFDLGLIMQGPDMNVTIQGKGIKCLRDNTKDINPLCMGVNYVAPLQSVINKLKFPWYIINEDPRYVPICNRDIINDEVEILSQINCEVPVKRIVDYGVKAIEHREHILKYRYAGIEKMFLTSYKKVDFTDPENIIVNDKIYKKSRKFIIAVNGGADRLKFIKKWVLEQDPTQIIYGKWSDADKSEFPNNFEEKGIINMQDDMWESMFTFIPCFEKRMSNFVTQKFWKMIYYGIIPFVDKNSYDTDNILPIPEFFRVETPEEMWDKINKLYDDKEKYTKCLKYFYSLLEDKYFNGEYIGEIFNPIIKKYEK